MLKTNWERTYQHPEVAKDLLKKAVSGYSTGIIGNIKLLSNGCGNSNYRVTFKSSPAILLRIYLRDSLSMKKESKLLKMIDQDIPCPKMFLADSTKKTLPFFFSINQFVKGELMRDVILRGEKKDIQECAFSAGEELSKLKNYKFDSPGFLTEDLQITPFPGGRNLPAELKRMLSLDKAKKYIREDSHNKLNKIISEYLLEINSCNLVHGDYDPANILVKKIDGKYKIAAVLDWEFAFSGSSLFDAGSFLRYSHLLPSFYEESFVSGLQSNGMSLQPNWKKEAKLMDMLSLLSLLNENSHSERPVMIEDIISLIEYSAETFETF